MSLGSPRWSVCLAGAAIALVVGASRAAAQAPATPTADGAALYRQNCRSCHGGTGTPPQRMATLYPELKPFPATLSVDSIVVILHQGRGKNMKSFTGKLTDAEMTAVAKYVKTLGGPTPAP